MSIRLYVLVMSLLLASSWTRARSSPDDLAVALARLGDRSAKVRAQAVLVLGSIEPDAEIRVALRERLSDPAPIVRAAAAKALGRRPTPDLMGPLRDLARDPDPMVTKWASWALRRTVASLRRLRIIDTTLRIQGTREAAAVGRTFESALLRGLVTGNDLFEIDPRERSTLDFSEDSATDLDSAPSTADVNRFMREGRFDMAALALGGRGAEAPDDPPCPLQIVGTLEMREGSGEVTVQASIRLVLLDGFPVVDGRVNLRSVPRAEDSRDRDEYTLEVTPAQLRLQAAEEAGRMAAEDLQRRLRAILQEDRREEGGT